MPTIASSHNKEMFVFTYNFSITSAWSRACSSESKYLAMTVADMFELFKAIGDERPVPR